jgi:thiol-disulfide isomerase/thioredoxin
MKKKISFYMLASAMLLMSCQQQGPGAYNIVGTTQGINDGDTLYLTTDVVTGDPIDSVVVKGGKFKLNGKTDSISFAVLYSKKTTQLNVPFFLEPGKIMINLSTEPGKSRISGSGINNNWQTLTDTLTNYSKRMQEFMASHSAENMDDAQRASANAQLQAMEQSTMEYVVSMAERNINNELGFFLVTNFMDDSFPPEVRGSLITKMPSNMRQRPIIKELQEQLQAMAKTEVDSKAPELNLPSPEGKPVSLLSEISQHRLTLIDFWASWCAPCRQDMPEVVKLYAEYKGKGLGIVGVSLDNDKDAWVKAIQELGITWTQMSDLKGWQSQAAATYAVKAIPQTFLIDQQGTIVAKGLRGQELADFVKNALK